MSIVSLKGSPFLWPLKVNAHKITNLRDIINNHLTDIALPLVSQIPSTPVSFKVTYKIYDNFLRVFFHLPKDVVEIINTNDSWWRLNS